MEVRVADLLETLDRQEGEASPVRVYWVRVRQDRTAFAGQILGAQCKRVIVPLVVRRAGFQNPNSVYSDFLKLLDDDRESVTAQLNERPTQPVDFVLLGRSELGVAAIASPIQFPSWVPGRGGTTVDCCLVDLTYKIEIAFNHPTVQIGELARQLHKLNGALLGRVQRTFELYPRRVSAFHQVFYIDLKESRKLADCLGAARTVHERVTEPSAFRPTFRPGRSLISRVLAVAARSPPDKLTRASKALAEALNLDSPGSCSSIAAVLSRPGQRDGPEVEFARGVIVSSYWASQFVTAAAHADEYPKLAGELLRSVRRNLTASLVHHVSVVERSMIK